MHYIAQNVVQGNGSCMPPERSKGSRLESRRDIPVLDPGAE